MFDITIPDLTSTDNEDVTGYRVSPYPFSFTFPLNDSNPLDTCEFKEKH